MKRLSHFLLGITFSVCALAVEKHDIPFEHLLSGDHSAIDHTAVFYIRADYEFDEFWEAHYASDSEPPPVPDVDFEKYSVVAFLAGPRPSSGYSVAITRIRESADKISLDVSEIYPCNNTIVLTVLTEPFHVVKMPRRPGQAVFDFSLIRNDSNCAK